MAAQIVETKSGEDNDDDGFGDSDCDDDFDGIDVGNLKYFGHCAFCLVFFFGNLKFVDYELIVECVDYEFVMKVWLLDMCVIRCRLELFSLVKKTTWFESGFGLRTVQAC